MPRATTLEVTFRRLNERQSDSVAVREDGVTVHIPGYGPAEPLPHDLAHFGVERTLGLKRGFWGSVAAGAVYGTVISGRQRPHASERSRVVMRENNGLVNLSEALVGGFLWVMQEGLDRDAPRALALIERSQGACSTQLSIDRSAMERVVADLRDLIEVWRSVDAGESLRLEWDLPLESPAVAPRHRKRAAVRRR